VKQSVTVEDLEKMDRDEMRRRLYEIGLQAYEAKEAEITPEIMRIVESRYLMLPIIDRLWVDHLHVMDALKTGIGLRGYGQKDPRVEYEKEAYEIFEDLKNNIADEAIKGAFRIVIEHGPAPDEMMAGPQFESLPTGEITPQPSHIDERMAEQLLGPIPGKPTGPVHTNLGDGEPAKPVQRADAKVGRNDLCPCGSGKKYKKCHGSGVA